MGQSNQFQSRGAIQAPSAAQMGQRGQSVGRCKTREIPIYGKKGQNCNFGYKIVISVKNF